jgi:ComF family protein
MKLGVAGVLDLILPRACVSCGGSMREGIVCDVCWLRMPALPSPRCDRCGHPRREGPCTFCDLLPPFVRAARSVCWVPSDASSAAVHALKYEGWSAVAPGMAERMARLSWPSDVVSERSVVIPVPLSSTRLRERGYNQAALLARPLASRWGITCDETALTRTRHTVTQTKLTPSERSTNVHGAFCVSDGSVARISGAHVMLVDDVLTTGSTLNAAASALFDSGARILSYITFGRARTASD